MSRDAVIVSTARTPLTKAGRGAFNNTTGATLGAILADLDRQFPGLRFRMVDEQEQLRPHMRVFVNGRALHDLAQPLGASDDVAIVQALSGG